MLDVVFCNLIYSRRRSHSRGTYISYRLILVGYAFSTELADSCVALCSDIRIMSDNERFKHNRYIFWGWWIHCMMCFTIYAWHRLRITSSTKNVFIRLGKLFNVYFIIPFLFFRPNSSYLTLYCCTILLLRYTNASSALKVMG